MFWDWAHRLNEYWPVLMDFERWWFEWADVIQRIQFPFFPSLSRAIVKVVTTKRNLGSKARDLLCFFFQLWGFFQNWKSKGDYKRIKTEIRHCRASASHGACNPFSITTPNKVWTLEYSFINIRLEMFGKPVDVIEFRCCYQTTNDVAIYL